MRKAEQVLSEVRKKYSTASNKKRVLFQNRRRISKLEELAISFKKRKTITDSSQNNLNFGKTESGRLVKLKTSQFENKANNIEESILETY